LLTVMPAGCSAEQTVTLDGGMSGESRISLELSDYLVSYVQDLSASLGVQSDRIFEPAAIEARLAQLDSIDLVELNVPETGRLEMTVAYDDLVAALEEPAKVGAGRGGAGQSGYPPPLSTGTTASGAVHLRLELTPQILDSVIAMSPWNGTLLADILLPPDRTTMSGEDYIDYLVWALEEYEDPEVIRESLQQAAVALQVRVPGRVQNQRGGRRSSVGVLFNVPVVDLVTLEEERVYELWYLPE